MSDFRESCPYCGTVNNLYLNSCDKPGCLVIHYYHEQRCVSCDRVLIKGESSYL